MNAILFSSYFTGTLSFLTLLVHIAMLGFIVALIWNKHPLSKKIIAFFGKNALMFGFFLSLAALLGSLTYSEVIGFEPCSLCWWQRIFMYPQVIMFGIAWWKKDWGIALYSIILSVLGATVGLYQSYVLLGGTSITPCTAVASACSKLLFLEFGYITLPLMSATIFLSIALLMLSRRIHEKHSRSVSI